MRFTLAATSSPSVRSSFRSSEAPITVKLKPAVGGLGEHSYTTDNYALRSMLNRHTDLSGLAITDFMRQIESGIGARLSSVELNDRVLRDVGFFVD